MSLKIKISMVERLTRSYAKGMEFKSWASQILQTVANGSPALNIYESSCVAPTRKWASQTRLHASRNTASVMKGLDVVSAKREILRCKSKSMLLRNNS